ncbi:MAG: response regulator, partial [Algicola sp.]|nr:response regulator [Algicola sp.]
VEGGVLAIHQHNKRLWTCPSHHEFTSYDLANNQWQGVSSQLTPSETLKCNRLIHSQQGVWGISLRTVFRLSPDSNKIITELNEPGVATVLEVGDNLWLVRAEELVKYHLPTGHKTRIRLSQLENLGHSARNNSFFDAQTQQLYIPVSKRLLRVNLNQIKPQNNDLTVNLREFSLFNHPVDVWRDQSIKADASIAYAKSVQLDYSQYMFQLSFAADSLGNAQDVLYRYRLKGFDSHWIDTTADKAFALYSGVSDGHYRFDVQATRDPNNWPTTSKSTEIIITPPWWKTWWAYMSYAIVLIKLTLSILWLVYRRKLAEKDRQSVVAVAKAKEQFFANVSHEFRTPLTLILGPITRLREKAQEPSERKALAVVERNAHRLATMVDQILDLAKLQGFKQTTLRVQNVCEVVDFVVQSFQDLVSAQQITLVIDNQTHTPPWVDVMPDTLEKILTNLLSNAFKYGGSGTTVTVIVATQNDHLKLCVNDTGKGMGADDLAVVFERFTRIDETSHTAPGTGIGLALVKELVEHHHGSITVESEVNKGSRFTVSMPLSQTQSKPEEDVIINARVVESSVAALASSDSADNSDNEGQLIAEQTGDRPHILVIEDNPDMRQYITNLLEQQYQCSSAENGQLGLEQAIATVPDLIISDVMMPVMDGFEVAKSLREQECTSHIPLILLTAKDDVDSRMQGWQQNIDDYIAKHFHQRELLIRVENLLAIRTLLKKRFATLLNQSVSQGAPMVTGMGITKTLQINDVRTDDLGDKNIEFIKRFEKLIADNFHNKDFNRKEAASEMALSERQLHRKLAGLVDYNFSDFLRQFRLQQACNLLGRGFQVARISDEVGFSSPSYFSSCFKAEFGMTVKQYEKKQALE